MHWVQSEQLRTLMARISARRWAADGTGDKDVESSPNAEKDVKKVSTLAAELAAMATNIPSSVNLRTLSASDRTAFSAEANNLHDQAMSLQRAAEMNQIEQMQRVMREIDGTCISCHSRFRDLTGVLNMPRADLRTPNPTQARAAAPEVCEQRRDR
jgi:hypothetical protein